MKLMHLGQLAAVLVLFALFAMLLVVISGLRIAAPSLRVVGPAPDDLGAEAVTIPSRSGSLLRGWLVRGKPGAGAVVVLHGIRADRAKMLNRIRLLKEAGYSVLAIDLQANGESPGKHITFGHLEALDAQAAVAFARERLPGNRVGAIGVSLGGAATLLGPQPLPVDALVLEAVFPDIDHALANRLSFYLGPAGRLLAPLYLAIMPPFLGVHASELRPIDHIGEVVAPLLIIAGKADRYTPIDESRALFARARAPKQLWEVEGAGHVDFAAYAPDEYRRRVLDFFGEYLRLTPR